jgi:hypothetical protein
MTHPSTARPHRAARPRSATKWRSRRDPFRQSSLTARLTSGASCVLRDLTYRCCEAHEVLDGNRHT